jgi:2-polyprenyl-3-methyl-5-hydroxy-6-metoxy-1,4-benzoquinol methylase
MAKQNFTPQRLDRTRLPAYALFADSCRRGLSVVYPFKPSRHPDDEGWKYSACWPPSYPAFGRLRALLAVHEALEMKPHRALEMAAGGGGLAACLAQRGCDVVVNDLREELVEEAIKEYKGAENICVVGGDMFSLSAERIGKFDLVVACEVIEHVARPRDFLNHLKSFLTPEGRILLTTPNGSYFRNKLPTYSEVSDVAGLEARQFKPDADGHLFLLTPLELFELVTSAGLHVERFNAWGTALLSGHMGLRYLANPLALRAAYEAERLLQLLPSISRKYFCAQLSVLIGLP